VIRRRRKYRSPTVFVLIFDSPFSSLSTDNKPHDNFVRSLANVAFRSGFNDGLRIFLEQQTLANQTVRRARHLAHVLVVVFVALLNGESLGSPLASRSALVNSKGIY
jgi:hypothetical protein